jgi:hypothetical protein
MQMNYKNFMILSEGWVDYKVSNNPKVLLYDFYVLSYLSTLPLSSDKKGFSGKMIGRDPNEIKLDIDHAQDVLLPVLAKKLKRGLFFGICAELRHLFDNDQKYGDLLKNKLLVSYARYYYETKSGLPKDLKTVRDFQTMRVKADSTEYKNSYEAAAKAIKKTGSTFEAFANLAGILFTECQWNSSYGGKAWAGIAEGYIRLIKAHTHEELQVAIDHAYDLQHNTGTALNKVKDFNINSSMTWLQLALDHKRDAKNMYELLPHCSSDMRKLALETFKVANVINPNKPKPEKNTDNKSIKIGDIVSINYMGLVGTAEIVDDHKSGVYSTLLKTITSQPDTTYFKDNDELLLQAKHITGVVLKKTDNNKEFNVGDIVDVNATDLIGKGIIDSVNSNSKIIGVKLTGVSAGGATVGQTVYLGFEEIKHSSISDSAPKKAAVKTKKPKKFNPGDVVKINAPHIIGPTESFKIGDHVDFSSHEGEGTGTICQTEKYEDGSGSKMYKLIISNIHHKGIIDFKPGDEYWFDSHKLKKSSDINKHILENTFNIGDYVNFNTNLADGNGVVKRVEDYKYYVYLTEIIKNDTTQGKLNINSVLWFAMNQLTHITTGSDKHIDNNSDDIKVGDSVSFKTGDTSGTGTVESIDSLYKYHVYVKTINDSLHTDMTTDTVYLFGKSALQKIKISENNTSFKVGDIVKFKRVVGDSTLEGTAKITNIDGVSTGIYYDCIILSSKNYHVGTDVFFKPFELEKIDPSDDKKFNTGDVVIVSTEKATFTASVVDGTDHGDHQIIVKKISSQPDGVYVTGDEYVIDVKFITNTKSPEYKGQVGKPVTFKINTGPAYITNGFIVDVLSSGKLEIQITSSDSDPIFKVGLSYIIDPKLLSLEYLNKEQPQDTNVSSTKPAKFNVGEIVKYKRQGGAEGTAEVVRVPNGKTIYYDCKILTATTGNFEIGSMSLFIPTELKKVNSQDTNVSSAKPAKFAIGETVVYDNPKNLGVFIATVMNNLASSYEIKCSSIIFGKDVNVKENELLTVLSKNLRKFHKKGHTVAVYHESGDIVGEAAIRGWHSDGQELLYTVDFISKNKNAALPYSKGVVVGFRNVKSLDEVTPEDTKKITISLTESYKNFMILSEDLRSESDEYYYHVTLAPYLPLIQKNGLLIGRRHTVSNYATHSKGKIFLCDIGNVEWWKHTIEAHAFDQFDDETYHECIAVKIKKDLLQNVKLDREGTSDSRGNCYYVTKNIPAEVIELA